MHGTYIKGQGKFTYVHGMATRVSHGWFKCVHIQIRLHVFHMVNYYYYFFGGRFIWLIFVWLTTCFMVIIIIIGCHNGAWYTWTSWEILICWITTYMWKNMFPGCFQKKSRVTAHKQLHILQIVSANCRVVLPHTK